MLLMKRVGRMSLSDITRRGLFNSVAVCKDDANRLIIIGSTSHDLTRHNGMHLRVHKKEKVQPHKAILSARMKGRLVPNSDDMISLREVNLSLVDINAVNTNMHLDVYSV